MNMQCDREFAARQPIIPGLPHPHVHENHQLAFAAVTVILVGGGMIQHFGGLLKIPFPYTMLLLVYGLVLGLWVLFDPNFTLQPGMIEGSVSWSRDLYPGFALPPAVLQCNVTRFIANDLNNGGSHLGNGLRGLAEMSPHLLLNIVLPPLLFESAFAIDWHIFEKVSGYAVFLALPGLIVCTLLTGWTYMAIYGWSWEPAMLVGGILSATDPVAVVALLKELGVKKSLATLIEAESLLNDGTAVVVYSILLKAVQAGGLAAWTRGVTTSPLFEWHIIWTMTRMSILGPLFGIIVGMLAVRWLQANAGADRDANVEVISSLALPFAVFYMAETGFGEYAQMSGVLAVVCFGLVFASPYGQSRIDPRVVHFLHEFWGMVGHLINTFLFTLSGIIIVLSIDPRSSTFGTDLGIAFAMYGLLTVYRSVVMFAVIPLFNFGHYDYTWREALVISWGGLRGAVGLALAVAVFGDEIIPTTRGGIRMFGDNDGVPFGAFDDQSARMRYQQIVLLHVSMIVLLTLMVNAPTSGFILKKIGLTKLSNERATMLQLAQSVLNNAASSVKAELEHHPIYTGVEWESVQRLASFDEMTATIFGHKYDHTKTKPWPSTPKKAPHSPESSPISLPKDLPKDLPKQRRASTEDMTPEEQVARARWHTLRLKLAAAAGFMGESKFYEQFQERLRAKRLKEGKSVILTTLKSGVWTMFEAGQVRPHTAQFLKERIMAAIDDMDSGRGLNETNPLPFEPLRDVLKVNRAVTAFASKLEGCATGSWLLKPIVRYANTLVLREFERGYDATVGYYMGFEALLASHDHGHKFSLDELVDSQLKQIVKKNINDATDTIAMLRLDWPKLCQSLNILRASRHVLNKGQNIIDHMSHEGGLHETEVERMLDLIAVYATSLNSLDPAEALPEDQRDNFYPKKFSRHTEEAIATEKKRVGLQRMDTMAIKPIMKQVDEPVKLNVSSSSSDAVSAV